MREGKRPRGRWVPSCRRQRMTTWGTGFTGSAAAAVVLVDVRSRASTGQLPPTPFKRKTT